MNYFKRFALWYIKSNINEFDSHWVLHIFHTMLIKGMFNNWFVMGVLIGIVIGEVH